MNDIFLTIMADKKESGGGFDKTTDFKWFGIGLLVFLLIWVMPTPESMLTKAEELFNAGVRRINVSLDHLDPDKFKEITRWGDLEKVQ